jgi:beta-glucosidase/6-phospho-beta-glucosidase/beta-galactosidase
VEPSGIALDFWHRYEHHLDRAVAAGCDSFRLSIEWARCQPAAGAWDTDAFDHYAEILRACHERGLAPLVTLHHFCHPHWLGDDFWLQRDAPEQFAAWVGRAADGIGSLARAYVTINEINIYALQTYMTGDFPPGRRADLAATIRTLDHMLAGHVLAYTAIKARQPDATVSTNNFPFSIYEIDRLLVDLLLARSHGVDRDDLHPWLVERRATYYAGLSGSGLREQGLRRIAASAIPLEQAFPRTLVALAQSQHERPVDVVQIDYYDPVVSHHLRLPGHRTSGGRSALPARMLWDDPPNPPGLTRYCRLNIEPGLDLWLVENGLCNRVRRGRSYPRLDGWDRVRYLKENLAALMDSVDAGLPVTGYWHWTLADNYEWGSYEPRFGLYGIDRERGVRWSECDSMGADAAGTYRRIIEGLRAGDRTVLL